MNLKFYRIYLFNLIVQGTMSFLHTSLITKLINEHYLEHFLNFWLQIHWELQNCNNLSSLLMTNIT